MAKQIGFYHNSDVCVGCKTCQIACKDKNHLPVGVMWRRVVRYGGGEWLERDGVMTPQGMFGYYLSVACNHCEDALCVKVCPTGAIQKGSDGAVLINSENCVGCRYCEWACPYRAPQFNDELGVMTKCDSCQDLVSDGQDPACVSACPMRALEFGDIEELRAKYGDEVEIEPFPNKEITSPALVINPNRKAVPTGSDTGRILNMEGEI